MSDPKLEPIGSVIRSNNLYAVAFVPGPNFKPIFARDFHLMKRPLVIIVTPHSDPVAIVLNLEMVLQMAFLHANFIDAHAPISSIRLTKTDREIKCLTSFPRELRIVG